MEDWVLVLSVAAVTALATMAGAAVIARWEARRQILYMLATDLVSELAKDSRMPGRGINVELAREVKTAAFLCGGGRLMQLGSELAEAIDVALHPNDDSRGPDDKDRFPVMYRHPPDMREVWARDEVHRVAVAMSREALRRLAGWRGRRKLRRPTW